MRTAAVGSADRSSADLLSRMANRLFRILAGCQLTDATTGIKMFTPRGVRPPGPRGRPVGWAVAFEMAIKAQLAGLRLGEVPIISIDRLYGGKSTFRLGPWTGEYLRWFCGAPASCARVARDRVERLGPDPRPGARRQARVTERIATSRRQDFW